MKNQHWMSLVFTQFIFSAGLAQAAPPQADVPALSQRYSQLEDYYNKADQALCACSMKPLSRFHEDYAGCYWIIKNVKGEYDSDAFVIGIATYSLSTPQAEPTPGDGPLFPPEPPAPDPGAGVSIKRKGPAVVYRESFSQDEVGLDGMGVTEFPTATHSDSENALAISVKTNISTIGPATDTSYLRTYSKDGNVALKEVFTASAGTAIGYGYCWKAKTQKP